MKRDLSSMAEGERSVTQHVTWTEVVEHLFIRCEVCKEMSKKADCAILRESFENQAAMYQTLALRLLDEIDSIYRDGL